MDTLFIEGLRIPALIGVHARERLAPQTLVLDVWIRFETRIAALSDSLIDALDYEAVAQRLADFITQTEYVLVETLAEACADLILTEFGAHGVRLKVSKPEALPNATAVGVEIERGSLGE